VWIDKSFKNDDKDDDNDDGDDVFSIDVEEELRKKGKKSCGHKKGRMLCPCANFTNISLWPAFLYYTCTERFKDLG